MFMRGNGYPHEKVVDRHIRARFVATPLQLALVAVPMVRIGPVGVIVLGLLVGVLV